MSKAETRDRVGQDDPLYAVWVHAAWFDSWCAGLDRVDEENEQRSHDMEMVYTELGALFRQRPEPEEGDAEWLHGDDVRMVIESLLVDDGPALDEETREKEWEWAELHADRVLSSVRRLRSHREAARETAEYPEGPMVADPVNDIYDREYRKERDE